MPRLVCLIASCLFPLAALTADIMPVPAPPIIGAKSYLVVDSRTGAELASLNPDDPLPPASLTKLMTTYVAFDALARGQLSLDEEVTISEKAWRMEGSRMFVEVGSRVSVKELLLGMIVQSGNDASVALAEHIAGSESVFAEMMNQHAERLGMRSSQFVNATGLPDDGHLITSRDLATLTRAMIADFPEYYPWHAEKEYTYNDIRQTNRNTLLWRDPSVDGLKTGHTEDAGYCLVASAERNDMRIVSVVMGTSSDKARTEGTRALLNYGFRFFETRLLYRAGEAVTTARVWKSANESTQLGVLDDLYVTLRRGAYEQLETTLEIPSTIMAPLTAGQPIAELRVQLEDQQLLATPLLALDDSPPGSLWQRMRDSVSLWFE